MRLGRKISEGFAVDHEADRAAAPAPVAERPEPDAAERSGSADREQPACSGSRED